MPSLNYLKRQHKRRANNDEQKNSNHESEELVRLPVAHIPHTNERSRTRLWVKEQGLRKLMSVALSPT